MKNTCTKTVRLLFDVYNIKAVKWTLKISLTLLFVVIVNMNISGDDIAVLSENISFRELAVAVVLGFTGIIFQTLRWKYVLLKLDFKVSNRDVLKTLLRGCFLGFLTPGRFGELFRAVDLDPSVKFRSVIATVLDRAAAVMVVLVLGITASAIQYLYIGVAPLNLFVVPAIIIFAVAAVVVIFNKYCIKLIAVFAALMKFPVQVSNQSICFVVTLFKAPTFVLLSLLAHLFLLFQTAFLFYMFGYTDIVWNLLVGAQSYAFMIFIPFFIANAGIREYSFSLFMDQINWTHQSVGVDAMAIGAALLILISNIIIPAFLGLLWIYSDRKKNTTVPLIDHKELVLEEKQL